MVRRTPKPRRTNKQIAFDAERQESEAKSFVLSDAYVPPALINTVNGTYFKIDPDHAREILEDAIAGTFTDGSPGVASIEAQLETYDESIQTLYWEAVQCMIDPRLIEATLAARNVVRPKPVTKEEQARNAAQDVLAILPALENDPRFQHRKSNKPKLSLICRELFARGYEKAALIEAGLNRGTVQDALLYERARAVREGRELIGNLALTPHSRSRGGMKERSGSGKLYSELLEASHLLKHVGPVLAPKPTRGKKVRKAGQGGNSFEAFGHNGAANLDDDDNGE